MAFFIWFKQEKQIENLGILKKEKKFNL